MFGETLSRALEQFSTKTRLELRLLLERCFGIKNVAIFLIVTVGVWKNIQIREMSFSGVCVCFLREENCKSRVGGLFRVGNFPSLNANFGFRGRGIAYLKIGATS